MQGDRYRLPKLKESPMAIEYTPQMQDTSQSIMNPFLGYPNCPLIGRYNSGQYKIGTTLMHITFKCKLIKQKEKEKEKAVDIPACLCGDNKLSIPEALVYNIANIPEIIPTNKQANIKNMPQVVAEHYPPMDQISFIWIVSLGEMGKDFLNYLNHMYTLACTLFSDQKLKREVYYLPIYAYLPSLSGIMQEEVERGLSFTNYRGQYLSLHLKHGAPAFSPNNMRLGVEGMKKVQTKANNKDASQKGKKEGKKKVKYVEKEKLNQKQQQHIQKQQQHIQKQQQNAKRIEQKQIKPEQMVIEQNLSNELQNLFDDPEPIMSKEFNGGKKIIKQVKPQPHKGFIHFYTSVLLPHDYRIYYHWHIESPLHSDVFRASLAGASSIQQLLHSYRQGTGGDQMAAEISRVLGV